MAELEARKLKYLTSGTGALLMGILIEGNLPGLLILDTSLSRQINSITFIR